MSAFFLSLVLLLPYVSLSFVFALQDDHLSNFVSLDYFLVEIFISISADTRFSCFLCSHKRLEKEKCFTCCFAVTNPTSHCVGDNFRSLSVDTYT